MNSDDDGVFLLLHMDQLNQKRLRVGSVLGYIRALLAAPESIVT